MPDIKISEAFELPVFAKNHRVGERCSIFEGKDLTVASSFDSNQLDRCELICHAINTHDRLVEESAQLKADKAELLEFIQSIPDDVADIFEWHEANNFCVDELIEKHKGQPMNNKPCVTVIEHDDDFIKLEVNGKELEVAKETGGVFTVDGDDYFLPCHATNGRIIFDGFTIYHQKGGDCYVE